jgi:mannose-6-phosphate isomerase-like protein (cupin superfamily)
MPAIVNLDEAFRQVADYWSPRVIAIANGQYLKIARVKGELVWHAHAEEDELFMVHRGRFGIRYRDGREVILQPGDIHVVPRGVEHFPFATEEALIAFFEPAATRHTGDVISDKTKSITDQLAHLTAAGD